VPDDDHAADRHDDARGPEDDVDNRLQQNHQRDRSRTVDHHAVRGVADRDLVDDVDEEPPNDKAAGLVLTDAELEALAAE